VVPCYPAAVTSSEAPAAGEAPAQPRARAPRRLLRPLLRLLVQLALIAAAGWLAGGVLRAVGWHELLDRLRTADPWLTLVALALLVGRFVIWDVRWRLAFRELGDAPGPLHSFFTLLGAACANTLTPMARLVGGLLRARYVSSEGEHSFGRVFGVVVFDQLAHQVVLVITGWLAFAGMAWVLGMFRLALFALVTLLVASVLFDVALRHWQQGKRDRLVAWLTRRADALETGRVQSVYYHGREAVGVVRELLARPRLRRQALLLGVVYVLINAGAQWALFRALGHPIDMLTVLLAVTAGTAAGTFTGTPGGVGTTEAGMVLAYVALGVPQLDAGAGTLLFRGLHYVVVLALGLPALLVFEARLRRRAREEGNAR
jgi:uncharacterized protein (TIRG00374 family)